MTGERLLQFAFVVAVPIVVVAAVVVGLFAVGALFSALDHPQEMRARIEAAFRPKPRPARETGPRHYYLPYWKRG